MSEWWGFVQPERVIRKPGAIGRTIASVLLFPRLREPVDYAGCFFHGSPNHPICDLQYL